MARLAGPAARVPDHPNPLQRQPGKIGLFDHVKKPRFYDQNSGAGVLEVIADLRAFRGGIDRDRDDANPGGAEKDRHEFGPVPTHQSDAIGGSQSCVQQHSRSSGRGIFRLAIAPRRRAANEQPPIAKAFGLLRQDRGKRPLRELKCKWQVFLQNQWPAPYA
jgi:hypothetical protein